MKSLQSDAVAPEAPLIPTISGKFSMKAGFAA